MTVRPAAAAVRLADPVDRSAFAQTCDGLFAFKGQFVLCRSKRRRLISQLVVLLGASLLSPASLPGGVRAASDEVLSGGGLYRVSARPVSSNPRIGRFHQWTIAISTTRGAPVSHARVSIAGGMPDHGHGLPSQPQVTRELRAGVYLVEGMRFNMRGAWELKVAIASPTGRDVATLAVRVDF
ncbi:MAG: FixH family protein [Burkholderiaceae bacterium]